MTGALAIRALRGPRRLRATCAAASCPSSLDPGAVRIAASSVYLMARGADAS